MQQITRLVTAFLCFTLLFSQAHASETLKPEPEHPHTLLEIISALSQGHYNKQSLDDELSAQLLDNYLGNLDPSRSYFYARDIARFEKLRTQLDDQIRNADLDAAYAIYARFQERLMERLNFSLAQLRSEEVHFDFSLDETLLTDRSEANWAVSEQEMDNLWHKRLKSALLGLKLAGKTLPEARELLIKRYENQLKRAEQTKSEDVFQTYANALAEIYDPHTQYFSPRSSENFRINMSLSLEGIGAVLQADNEFTKVVRLVPGGPAAKTGQLKTGDLITGVAQGADGEMQDIVGWRLDDVVDKIRGPKGTLVRLQIQGSETDKTQRKIVKIQRNKVKLEEQAAHSKIETINHQGREYRIGVIDIPAFYIDFDAMQRGDKNYKSTTRDVEKLVAELKQKDIDGLVIDLRNNGGGSLREANELVGLFIPRGPTVQIRDPDGRIDILGDFDPKVAYKGPMAVLVNRLSASASEIFAGAIQDYQRGVIVGNQTFGKGTVQTLYPLNHGQIKLTHAKFYRISGESTQHKGVVPDITLPTLYNKEEIGESALDGALPWDTVHAVRHGTQMDIRSMLPELVQRSQSRIQKDPDFLFMQAQVDHQEALRKDDFMSLNEQTLQQERERIEAWQLKTENTRRARKSLPPVSDLDKLDENLPKDEQGNPISQEAQAILRETGHILLDMVELNQVIATAEK